MYRTLLKEFTVTDSKSNEIRVGIYFGEGNKLLLIGIDKSIGNGEINHIFSEEDAKELWDIFTNYIPYVNTFQCDSGPIVTNIVTNGFNGVNAVFMSSKTLINTWCSLESLSTNDAATPGLRRIFVRLTLKTNGDSYLYTKIVPETLS